MPTVIVLNIFIQCFDFVATYFGSPGHSELNPLLNYGFQTIGLLPTLLVTKAWAFWALWKLRNAAHVIPLLWIVAAFYTAISIAPWTAIFLRYLLLPTT